MQKKVHRILQGKQLFFSNKWILVKDWHTNPTTQFTYRKDQHWTRIPTLSAAAGDIKYVWEKARFTFLYDLIRFDFHGGASQSKFVLACLEDWIDQNPVNRGPHWVCSQEISLRVLNWIFALHHYKYSPELSNAIFDRIIRSIYAQMRHVAAHFTYSRLVLHNNHTLTEALALYSVGLLFPFFPESSTWRQGGKKWFQAEIATQIFEDGTYIQFSMNYHRVAVQLLTWALRLGELNGDRFDDKTYQKAGETAKFLQMCQDEKSGQLANLGNNDGALFFPLTECHYRDFRPQLNALATLLNMPDRYGTGIWDEEAHWFGLERTPAVAKTSCALAPSMHHFEAGGYYVLLDDQSVTLLRCASYCDRPFQADNLHLDIWVDGRNILRDAGTYSYNTEGKWMAYFAGTTSHNTVVPGGYDQMQKGPGFTWSQWVRTANGGSFLSEENGVLEGEFIGFTFLRKPITHRRRVTKAVGRLHWIVEDWLENAPESLESKQYWHPDEAFLEHYQITAFDTKKERIAPKKQTGYFSEYYGSKTECIELSFSFTGSYIRTEIAKLTD
ncbi:heparinase II/III family protein [Dyadobacter crusticola]|uniref:heparinase II/III family protein n=1 Tax=Dyadobacter crusticola TaxID=292407 RepID=UPI00146FAC2D|nr:alginate lyase family protein [Dyadobacter crusticola]